MTSPWNILVEMNPAGAGGAHTFALTLRAAGSGKEVTVIEPCASLEEFKTRVGELGEGLQAAVADAEKRAAELSADAAGGPLPEEVWAKMSGMASDDEMASYFNSLSETARSDVAAYVFGNVGMFSGKGPVFAQRYHSDSHLMD